MTDVPIVDFVRSRMHDLGHGRLVALADEVNKNLPREHRISVSALRKLFYDERSNYGIKTLQPLLDYFRAVDRGERPSLKTADKKAALAATEGAR